MSIVVENARKQFGDFVALDDVSHRGPRRLADRPARAERQRQVDPAAGDRRARAARLGPGADLRRGHDPGRGPGPRRRLLLPALRRLQAHDGERQRRLRALDPQAAEGGDREAGPRAARARPARGLQPPLPVAALRRPAPAHGARPGARGRAEGAAARRAVRRARRAGADRSCASGCAACTTRST